MNSLPAQIADEAESIVNMVTHTHYRFDPEIDPETGVFLCDCNEFVAFVLHELARPQYDEVPRETGQPRPRAFEYYVFLAGLPPGVEFGWERIEALADARRGDLLVWRFAVEAGHDTGHVVFLAETPVNLGDNVYSVRVYDSARSAHFDDTRGATKPFQSGVGSGFLHFQVDALGRPTAFLFSPISTGFETAPIAIGRLHPLS